MTVNPIPAHHPRESRSEEVLINGFGQKSKAGAISVAQTIIKGKSSDPYMVKEKISRDQVELLVRENAGNKQFSQRYHDFLCFIMQTPEERQKFTRTVGI